MDSVNHPSVTQWNNYQQVLPQPRQNTNGASPDMFPNISTVEPNIPPPPQVRGEIPPQQMQHSQSHDFNSPTSTNSSFPQPKQHNSDDYRYSHTPNNWFYGHGAGVQPKDNINTRGKLPSNGANYNGAPFDEVNGHFAGQDSAKPRTETSLTPMSSPSYASTADGDSPRVRERSDSVSSKGRIHKDAQGKTKRSRMGCLTCRHRKKRCCERRPKCQECERLGLKCTWPVPGLEHRNRPNNAKINDDMHYDAFHGHIKILRGIVEYRINAAS